MPPSQEPAEPSREASNFAVLTLQMIVIRIGWIFKTESVIIPAFLDSIAGPAWLRGLLPVLNRTGQSVPAFLLSASLRAAPLKGRLLAGASLAMAVPFLVLAAVMRPGVHGPGPAVVFLSLYLLFWCAAGLNMVVTGTLQGKLIRADHRGRLITASVFGSVIPAVGCAWWLLPGWLAGPAPSYDLVFLFTGVCFVAASGVAFGLFEQRDPSGGAPGSLGRQLRGAWQILRGDLEYRRTVVVASLFSSSIMVFPHYQALARERLDLGGGQLMVWVVVQNLSMGVASLGVGPLADRLGNRFALRVLVFAAAGIPVLALWLTTIDTETARGLFPLVFVGIGWIPIGFRVITNYLLEIAPADEHPRYLSLTQLCTAAAFTASPLFGLLIDLTSFEWVFALETGLLLLGGLLTFGLVEPRERLPSKIDAPDPLPRP